MGVHSLEFPGRGIAREALDSDTKGANESGAGCVDGEPFARGADGPDAWD